MNSTKQSTISSTIVGAAIALIIVTGLIHLVTAPDDFSEAAYKGAMFVANGFAALIALAVVTGLIHLTIAPDYFSVTSVGALFVVDGIAALIAALGIYRGSKTWGWGLGLLVTSAAIMLRLLSLTVGLPGLGVEQSWYEPIGVLSLLVEGAYIVLALRVLFQNMTSQPNEPRLTAAR